MTRLCVDGVHIDTEKPLAWAVGPEGGFGWCCVWAPTEESAVETWLAAEISGVVDPDTVNAERVEEWDDLERQPSTKEWLQFGMATRCARCGEVTDIESGANILADEAVLCSNCGVPV